MLVVLAVMVKLYDGAEAKEELELRNTAKI